MAPPMGPAPLPPLEEIDDCVSTGGAGGGEDGREATAVVVVATAVVVVATRVVGVASTVMPSQLEAAEALLRVEERDVSTAAEEAVVGTAMVAVMMTEAASTVMATALVGTPAARAMSSARDGVS